MALGGEILTLRVSIPDAQDHDPYRVVRMQSAMLQKIN
jgi:hypothetical protein